MHSSQATPEPSNSYSHRNNPIDYSLEQIAIDLAFLLTNEELIMPPPDIAQGAFPLQQIEALKTLNTSTCINGNQVTESSEHFLSLTHRMLERLESLSTEKIGLYFNTESRRLGYYVEGLWRFILDQYANLHTSNLQVFEQVSLKNKKTIGEFDFLIDSVDNNSPIHAEVAYKYYLNTAHLINLEKKQDINKLSEQSVLWRGPNSKDSLEKKTSHLFTQQLKLKDHPSAQKLLQENLDIDSSALNLAFSLKGFLFDHIGQNTRPCESRHLNAIDTWLYIDELEGYLDHSHLNQAKLSNKKFYHLTKQQWINRFHIESKLKEINIEALKQTLDNADSPVMICFIDESFQSIQGKSVQLTKERQRIFVAPRAWPGDLSIKLLKKLQR